MNKEMKIVPFNYYYRKNNYFQKMKKIFPKFCVLIFVICKKIFKTIAYTHTT